MQIICTRLYGFKYSYLIVIIFDQIHLTAEWFPSGVVVKAMDCGIVISEFQTLYCVHFRTNTLGKGKNPLILPVSQSVHKRKQIGLLTSLGKITSGYGRKWWSLILLLRLSFLHCLLAVITRTLNLINHLRDRRAYRLRRKWWPKCEYAWAMVEHSDADISNPQLIPIVLSSIFGGSMTHYTSLQKYSNAITPVTRSDRTGHFP